MRLKVKQQAAAPAVHTELAPTCGWSVWNELVSCSDDQTMHKWNLQGDSEGKVSLHFCLDCTLKTTCQTHILAQTYLHKHVCLPSCISSCLAQTAFTFNQKL